MRYRGTQNGGPSLTCCFCFFFPWWKSRGRFCAPSVWSFGVFSVYRSHSFSRCTKYFLGNTTGYFRKTWPSVIRPIWVLSRLLSVSDFVSISQRALNIKRTMAQSKISLSEILPSCHRILWITGVRQLGSSSVAQLHGAAWSLNINPARCSYMMYSTVQ